MVFNVLIFCQMKNNLLKSHLNIIADEDLKKIEFKFNDVVGITAGASTPTIVTNEIVNYLQEYK